MFIHMIIILISFFTRTIILGNPILYHDKIHFITNEHCYFLAHIILLFKGAYASARKYTSLFKELAEYVHFKRLPLAIKNRIFVYYTFKFRRHFYKTNEVWKFLPDHYKFVCIFLNLPNKNWNLHVLGFNIRNF